jgi:hypothetical protein
MEIKEAVARVTRIRDRRRERAEQSEKIGEECEARATSADDVLNAYTRDLYLDIATRSKASAKAMHADADALDLVLGTVLLHTLSDDEL